jgi:peroxin-1
VRKAKVSPHMDWDGIAEGTEGFSGAELQTLVYNAHLEIVHAAIDALSGGGKESSVDGTTNHQYHVLIRGPPAKVT